MMPPPSSYEPLSQIWLWWIGWEAAAVAAEAEVADAAAVLGGEVAQMSLWSIS